MRSEQPGECHLSLSLSLSLSRPGSPFLPFPARCCLQARLALGCLACLHSVKALTCPHETAWFSVQTVEFCAGQKERKTTLGIKSRP